MKFSHSLQFNCVPEWTEHYLSYNSLKRSLYALERVMYEDRKSGARADTKSAPSTRFDKLDADFQSQFSNEFQRVLDFYVHEEEKCREQFSQDVLSEEDIKQLYITLNDAVFFFELNREGFIKITQKYSRYVNEGRGDSLKLKVEIDMAMEKLSDLQTMIGNIEREKASLGLQSLLRERVIFERNTVWQDMVEMERKTSALEVVQQSASGATPTTTLPDIEKSASVKATVVTHPASAHHLSAGAKAKKILMPVFCAALLVALWLTPIFDEGHMNRALAVVVFTIALWCTEALPLYATAMLVPLMVSIGDVLQPGYIHYPLHSQRPADVAKFIFGKMFSDTIMLLLGGFSLASALSKYGIAKMLATAILGRVGRNPGVILVVVMAITTIASFVMSNVAAPVLTFSLIQPLLRALGVDHPLAKSLVVGVAYAANIGGLISPISSPQNLFAMKDLGDKALGWGQWLAGSFPVAIVTTLTTWVVLRMCYRTSDPIPDVLRVKPGGDSLNGKQIYVCMVTVLTILLWLTANATKPFFGGLGVLAVFPLAAFFGSGMLSKDDFNGFLWNVVMLAMGGSAIGVVVNESGLLFVISQAISEKVGDYSIWVVTAIFSALMLFVATFVSHSVSSIIMTPVVVNVAKELVTKGKPANAPQLVVAVVTFVCSIGMGMPISGFPNITAMSLEDGAGRTYINTGDFLKTGVISSIIALLVCLTLAYFIFSFVL